MNRVDPSGHAEECIDHDYGRRGSTLGQLKDSRKRAEEAAKKITQQAPDLPNPFLLTSESSTLQQTLACNQTSPCLSSWEEPSWWDTNPKNPDYYSLSVSGGNVIGVTTTFVIDRYGNVYWGIGGNIGKSISPFTGSFNGGWIGSAKNNVIPSQGNIGSFLEGFADNGQAGLVGDAAITWSPFASVYISHTAVEYGGVVPFSLGVSVTYSFKIIDGK